MTEVLTPDEWQRIRSSYSNVMGEKHKITTVFEMQSVCAQLGLDQGLEDLERLLEEKHNEVDFLMLLEYVGDAKKVFFAPEPRDVDTIRAFAAVGGQTSEGMIQADTLKSMCTDFDLHLDAESTLSETLDYAEFKKMLTTEEEDGTHHTRLKLGFDYAALLEEQRRKQSLLPKVDHLRKKIKARQSVVQRMSVHRPSQRESTVVPHPEPAEHQQHDAQTTGFVPKPPSEEGDERRTKKPKRKGKNAKKPMSKQDTLGPHTRPCGRTGVYVDDTAQVEGSWLPSLSKNGKQRQAATSPILARIDARVQASFRGKIGGR